MKVKMICKKRWWFEIAYAFCFWAIALGMLDPNRTLRWLFVHGFYDVIMEEPDA